MYKRGLMQTNERQKGQPALCGNVFFLTCFIVLVFLIQICLGLYIYTLKCEYQKEHSKELKNQVLEILSDPEFCELNGCYARLEKDFIQGLMEKHKDLLIDNYETFLRTHQEKVPHNRKKRHDNLSGPPRPPGVKGKTGYKGDKGVLGLNDIPGLSGKAEIGGTPGIRGYKGEKGHIGLDGPKGEKGERGIDGVTGQAGIPGMNGLPGLKGDKGEKGYMGMDGPKGEKGERGPESIGLPGIPGSPGPVGPPGQPGKCKCVPKVQRILTKISKYNDEEYPGLPTRTSECLIDSVDDPTVVMYGQLPVFSVMIDSSSGEKEETVWGVSTEKHVLYEYDPTSSRHITYHLKHDVHGTASVITNRSFLYEASHDSTPLIVKYSLDNNSSLTLSIPGITSRNAKHLYTNKLNYLDFSVDENGLWVVFASPNSNHIAVTKVDDTNLEIQDILEVEINHEEFTEMFIVSGILYGIKREGRKLPMISFGLDLYSDTLYPYDQKLKNLFKPVKSVTYDHKHKHIRIVNQEGHLYKYPLGCKKKD